MEAHDYCRDLKCAVSDRKTKIHAVMGESETICNKEKKKVGPLVRELHTITEQHTARMEELRKQCRNKLTEGRIKKRRSARFKTFDRS